MKRKISLQELVEYLVQHGECSLDEADTLLHAFFEVIEQGLLTDKFVKIKGLGTFKLVAVSERESVNISTGERFQIGGHTKISFTPDANMKELINRPFAHFDSVDLEDDTDLAEFDYVDHLIEQQMAEDVTQAEEEVESQAQEKDETEHWDEKQSVGENGEELPSLNEEHAVTNEASNDIETTPTANETPSESTVEVPLNVENAQSEAIEAAVATEPKVLTNEEPEGIVEMPILEQKASTEAVEEASSFAKPLANEQPSATDSSASCHPNDEILASDSFKYTYTEKPPRRKLNKWKIATIVLGILLLMTLCYFAGYFRVLCPCSLPFVEELMQPKPSPKSKDIEPTLQPKPATSIPAPPSKPIPQVKAQPKPASAVASPSQKAQSKATAVTEKADSSKVSTPHRSHTHIVKVGDNLHKISRRYYGTDAYVSAIIKLNNLRNADNITIGKRLKLP